MTSEAVVIVLPQTEFRGQLLQTLFSHRAPSAQWEQLPILRVPGLTLWVWYRPPNLPVGLMVSVPPEIQAAYPAGFPFSLGDLLLAAGVDPAIVHSVSYYGSEWRTTEFFGPVLNHPLPPVGSAAQPAIAIQIHQQAVTDVNSVAEPTASPAAETRTGSSSEEQRTTNDTDPGRQKMMYDRIDKAWRSSVQMERQMAGLRQKLASVMAAMGKLDRDLVPDERLAAEREDRDAWHDARRWMRDLCAKCHREIKNFDVGMTSAAGRRNAIELLYRQVIEPRAGCTDLPGIRREFETYRRDMMNLQKSMHTALLASQQNGTQRAHRVLNTINRKIRERRARMREPLGSMNLDRTVRRQS